MTSHKTTKEDFEHWEDEFVSTYGYLDKYVEGIVGRIGKYIAKNFIDKSIIEEEIARHKKLICRINTYCEDPVCKKSKYVVKILHTLLKDD